MFCLWNLFGVLQNAEAPLQKIVHSQGFKNCSRLEKDDSHLKKKTKKNPPAFSLSFLFHSRDFMLFSAIFIWGLTTAFFLFLPKVFQWEIVGKDTTYSLCCLLWVCTDVNQASIAPRYCNESLLFKRETERDGKWWKEKWRDCAFKRHLSSYVSYLEAYFQD